MKSDVKYLLNSDFQRVKIGGGKKYIYVLLAKDCGLTYCFWLRLCNYGGIIGLFARYMHRMLSRKYGVEIPRKVIIGPGLYIGHCNGIVINAGTIIGKNCNLSHFVSIGTNHKTPAVIGDNVYIGPHVCIVENVRIGNNVTIGAGSIVTKDVPENATVVGNPARVINYNNPGRYIKNKV